MTTATAKEKAKSAMKAEIIFTVVELLCSVGIFYLISVAPNETIYSLVDQKPGPQNQEQRQRARYNERRDSAFANTARKVILIVIITAILAEILLEVFSINRLNKAVEMSESSPHEALKTLACHGRIQFIQEVLYGGIMFLVPAFFIRFACMITVGNYMALLEKRMEDQIVSGMNPVFGEGRDGVIRTYPPSDSESSIFPGISSDSSLF